MDKFYQLGKSAENYLKEILILQNKKGYVRSIDLADSFGFSKASISRAIKDLKVKQLVVMSEDKTLSLTEEGKGIAEAVYHRYRIIYNFLTGYLKVDADTAAKEACQIEHAMSDSTCRCLSIWIEHGYSNKTLYQS